MIYEYLDTNTKLSRFLNKLENNKTDIFALDIEGDSNLHQYGEKLCLVQIYDGNDAVIIDPFTTSIELIKELLENRSMLKIMYDAPGDRAFLYKNYSIDTMSILDLQTAVLLLDYEKRDLASVLKQTLGFDAGRSKKKFQMYNWTRRPLDESALRYALEDVIYLFELKEKLLSRIVEKNLLDLFLLKNIQAQNKPHIYHTKPRLLRSKSYSKLKRREQTVFEKLYFIREKHAREMNYPPNDVMPNHVLFQLAMSDVALHKAEFGKRIPRRVRQRIIDEMRKNLEGYKERITG